MPCTLDLMLAAARERAAGLKRRRAALEAAAGRVPAPPDFVAALHGGRVAVIAEIKRKSPSAGTLNATLDAAALARTYDTNGAAAISVLTDEPFFGGTVADLRDAARIAGCPVLRKDFIVSEEQLLEARAEGAAAALLIVRALGQPDLVRLIAWSHEIGLGTLVETHDAGEVGRAIDAGALVIGVNSRDLDTFAVDVPRALSFLSLVPSGCVAVAESGVSNREDVARAGEAGANAVLVGGALAASQDPGALLRSLINVPRHER